MRTVLTVVDVFDPKEVGPKAIVLKQLHEAGENVPAFVVLPSSAVRVFLEQKDQIVKGILQALPADKYVVRSAALCEDGVLSSMAGQFLSKLQVAPDKLALAIQEVHTQAKTVQPETSPFSIIIQVCMTPQVAGVVFTRDPMGGQEMLIEYTAGFAESVVGGGESKRIAVIPQQEVSPAKPVWLPQLQHTAQRIENVLDFPQDIEWLYANKKIYIVQSRPITSLSQMHYAGHHLLDTVLPKNTEFFYQQSESVEAFSRPTPLSVSILHSLYRAGGPIEAAYKKCGISYQSTNQFVQIGSQLYVDKQAEVKSLFPSLGYCKRHASKPRFETFSGLPTTLLNSLALQRIKVQIPTAAKQKIKAALYSAWPQERPLAERLKYIDTCYPLIFSVNLRTQMAWQRLVQVLGGQDRVINLVEYAKSQKADAFVPEVSIDQIAGKLVGNSFTIDDMSLFQEASLSTKNSSQTTLQSLTITEKAFLPKVQQLVELLYWREVGRWLSVKLISDIREAVYGQQVPKNLHQFVTREEYLFGIPDCAVLQERKKVYEKNSELELPRTLTSFTQQKTVTKTTCLSPGSAQGVLVTKEDLGSSQKDVILLVKNLTPDLTGYFSQIKGIITYEGGVLSHLAIMAREYGLPVVRTSPVHLKKLQKVVTIDTNTKEILF